MVVTIPFQSTVSNQHTSTLPQTPQNIPLNNLFPPLTPPPHPPTLRPRHAPPAPVAVSDSLPTHLIPCETLGGELCIEH